MGDRTVLLGTLYNKEAVRRDVESIQADGGVELSGNNGGLNESPPCAWQWQTCWLPSRVECVACSSAKLKVDSSHLPYLMSFVLFVSKLL